RRLRFTAIMPARLCAGTKGLFKNWRRRKYGCGFGCDRRSFTRTGFNNQGRRGAGLFLQAARNSGPSLADHPRSAGSMTRKSADCIGPLRALLCLLAAWLAAYTFAEDWPQFRGPNGTGVSTSGNVPVEFGPDKGVAWKVRVPAGKSSPVLSSRRIYLTGHEGD